MIQLCLDIGRFKRINNRMNLDKRQISVHYMCICYWCHHILFFLAKWYQTSFKNVFFQGVKQVLVKLGPKGSALSVEGEEPIKPPLISAPKVLDTTGARDTFTAAFVVALVEGKFRNESFKFSGVLATLFPIYQ